MSKLLDLPSKKIFIRDLQQAVKCVSNSTENQQKSIKEWQSKGRTFSVVWIQGTVLQVSHDSDMMLLDDGTGVVKVIGCCKIPHMPEKLKHGQYAMVIGQLMAVGNIPVLRALKFQNLTNHIVDLETCWVLEVLEHIRNGE
ncbi:recQ-mediated genome instability protein 2-like [Mytilus galloprovincialis]|uniref:recQ-mediated genome instability protein 2-like n=1 Tax=Mytilus galloprovincialis TaxID=29158 RepID=UPI003F7C8109